MTSHTYSGARLRRLGARITAPAPHAVHASVPGATRAPAWVHLTDLLHTPRDLDAQERRLLELTTENARTVLPLLGQQGAEVLRVVAAARAGDRCEMAAELVLGLARRLSVR